MSAATAPRVLVVDDDDTIRDFLLEMFTRDGYAAEGARAVGEARSALAAAAFDILILDLGLPDGDGIALCRELRAEGHSLAILMLTARTGPIERVLGLELGADDYLAKPFEPRELLVRARKLLGRRAATNLPLQARIARFGPWELDLLHRRLIAADGHLVMLPSSEYGLLRRMLERPGKVLSREELLPERGATVSFDRSLDIRISRLRQRLALEPTAADMILTVRGEGYMLASDVTFR